MSEYRDRDILPGEEIIVTVDKVVHYTPKAVLVKVEGEDKWVPRSQIIDQLSDGDWEELKKSGNSTTITLPEWLANEKEWS